MHCRSFVVAVAIAAAGALLVPAVAGAQTAETPRTAWGAPDLQGVWDFRSLTPMERPAELADQEVFTSEQAASFSGGDSPGAEPRPGGRRGGGRGGPGGGVQRLLVRLGVVGHDRPHVADRGAARRADPCPDGGRRPAGRGPRGGPRGRRPRRGGAGRLDRRAQPVGALHHGVQPGSADDAERLQQQHAVVPDRGPRRDPERDGPRRARRPAGRPAAPPRGPAAVDRQLARPLGRRHARRRDHQPPRTSPSGTPPGTCI